MKIMKKRKQIGRKKEKNINNMTTKNSQINKSRSINQKKKNKK